ncbi:MAG: IPT/TIG domain-containing protein [Acidobacteriota bacterium]
MEIVLSRLQGFLMVGLLFPALAGAQASVTLSVSGNDVVLNWSGGAQPYYVYRDSVPDMSGDPVLLLGGTSATTYTDAGAATNGATLYFYRVSDATKPTVTITGTVPPSPAPVRAIQVNGNFAGATAIYVNETPATLGANTFSAAGVQLFLGVNRVTATAIDSDGDVAFDQVQVTRDEGNAPPTIEFDPADGATTHDPTPLLKVRFCDADGRATLDPATRVMRLDAADLTGSFGSGTDVTCGSGDEGIEYSLQLLAPLAKGRHFLAGAIKDVPPQRFFANGAAAFVVGDPLITSTSPVEATVGTPVTITGDGFDPSGTNIVSFGPVQVPQVDVNVISSTQINTKVPVGAVGGPLIVEVNGLASNEYPFRVLLASGFTTITSVAIDDAMADANRTPILFSVAGTSDEVFQLMKDGTYEGKLVANNDPVGLPTDSNGALYFGSSFTGTNNGRVDLLSPPAPGSLGNLMLNTRLVGETNSRIYGLGAPAPDPGSGTSPRVYLLDGANGKVKRMDECYAATCAGSPCGVPPCFGVVSVRTGLTFTQSNSAIKSADGTRLYFTDNNSLKSMPIGGAAPTTHDNIGGPTGLANSLTTDGWPVLARRAAGGGQGNRIAVVDLTTTPTCGVGACPKYDLLTGVSFIDVDFGSDVDGPYVVVAEATKVYRAPKPTITFQAWNGTSNYAFPTDVDADFNPTTGQEQAQAQFVIMEADLNPLSLIPDGAPDPYAAKVQWTVEDPDDPSTNCQIDPDDWAGGRNFPCSGFLGAHGNDNRIGLGINNQWQEYDIYTMDGGNSSTAPTVKTKVVGGKSRVVLNLSGMPGDNYKVTAKVTVPVYGDISAETPVFTIWKRLKVEVDSMAACEGPLDPEPIDVMCTDVLDPDFAQLANAFKPAYVKIVPAASQNDPGTLFWYHVNDISEGGPLALVAMDIPNSGPGYWEAALHGAYEGPSVNDGDPDSEFMTPGGVLIGIEMTSGALAWAFSYMENIRDHAAYVSSETPYDDLFRIQNNALHETAHMFRLDHESGGILNAASKEPSFAPCQIYVIRRCVDYPGPFPVIPTVDVCTVTCP